MPPLSKLAIRTSLISLVLISPLLGIEVTNKTSSKIFCSVNFAGILAGKEFDANDTTPWSWKSTHDVYPNCDSPNAPDCTLSCDFPGVKKSKVSQKLTLESMKTGCYDVNKVDSHLEIVECPH